MIGLKTNIDVAQVLDGADEESGADDEQKAECDLQADPGTAQFERAAGGGSSLLFERVGEMRVPELQCGSKTEEQTGDDGDDDRDDEYAPVESWRKDWAVGGIAGHPANKKAKLGRRDCQANRRSRDAEEHAFGEKLAQDLRVGCSESKAHRELARAGGCAHQEKTADIDDGHRDDEQHHSHDDGERSADVIAHWGETLCSR